MSRRGRGGSCGGNGEIQEREREGLPRRHSRPVGRFDHGVAIPGDIDQDKVEASLNQGVLTVKLAKPAKSRPRHVQVKS